MVQLLMFSGAGLLLDDVTDQGHYPQYYGVNAPNFLKFKKVPTFLFQVTYANLQRLPSMI